MYINKLLDALESIADTGVNHSVILQLISYRKHYNSPVFIHVVNTHSKLINQYINTLVPSIARAEIRSIYSNLTMLAEHFNVPEYQEHVLQKFVVENNLQGVAIALELGVNINTTVSYTSDLLHSQIKQGFLQMAAFKFPTAWFDNNHNCTPLVLASLMGHLDIVKYLVKQGARLDCETVHHNTALDWATKRKHYKVEAYLRQIGASRNTTSDRGEIEAIAAWI
jgi:hypothetical protein